MSNSMREAGIDQTGEMEEGQVAASEGEGGATES